MTELLRGKIDTYFSSWKILP